MTIYKISATDEDHRAFWDGVVRNGDIPAGELTEKDQEYFNEALERLEEDQTPAFFSFDELRAAQLDTYDMLKDQDEE